MIEERIGQRLSTKTQNTENHVLQDLQSGPNGKEGFVQDVSSINGINFIIPMLIFSCPKAKNEFASKNGFLFLSECLLLMLVPSNKPKICLDIKGFTKPFLDVFKSWLETRRERIPEILAIIATVFALLLEDNETYFQNQFTVLEQDFEREITKTLVSHGPHILLQF
ncbi:unnamed protein product [Allacma fusca]|uniref:Uncharacterized protein n=1 Tax=Allacma fusca TaxID=39272 RepID=A0A8J2P6T0_9HEXA|nr:unnamed protein product [Allacma fusca]